MQKSRTTATRGKCFETLRKVHSAPSADSDDGCLILNRMAFCASKVGWAAGGRQVLRSVDGGKTWANRYENLLHDLAVVPWNIAPVDSAICWFSEWGTSSRGRLFKTVDGGESWESLRIDERAYPQDLCFLDSDVGWVLADSGSARQLETYLFHTSDAAVSDMAFFAISC
jgi:photosystem II stability/assembly factor-like uncharacterized protein